jgi:hypothetical protein
MSCSAIEPHQRIYFIGKRKMIAEILRVFSSKCHYYSRARRTEMSVTDYPPALCCRVVAAT